MDNNADTSGDVFDQKNSN
jgi:hypothetical protein